MKIISPVVTAVVLCCAFSLLITDTVNAAVVKTPGINEVFPVVIPDTENGVYLNVTTGERDYTGSLSEWHLNPYSEAIDTLNWWSDTVDTWYSPTGAIVGDIAITEGSVVGPAGTFIRPGSNFSATIGDEPGQFQLNAINYVGFRFISGEETDGYHYGYLMLLLGDSLTERSIVGVFYESELNVGITVGEAIPEPSSVLLLAGAAGLMALYRRRSKR